MASSADIDEFLAGPIVTWLRSCVDDIDNKLEVYENYFDGFPFRDVLLKIDPDPVEPIPTLASFLDASMTSARVRIFQTILSNIQTIYMAELNQVVVKVPDCVILAKEPSTKQALDQLKIMLTLLMGCAFMGPTQLYFVDRLKVLPQQTQEEIASCVQLLTMPGEQMIIEYETMIKFPEDFYGFTKDVATDRNKYLGLFLEEVRKNFTAQSCVVYENDKERRMSRDASTHLAVEICEYKSQIRRLRQQLDEKSDHVAEVSEECEALKKQNQKLQSDNQKLRSEKIQNDRLGDELEALREKAERTDFLEKEVIALRRGLIDAKSGKNRLDELLADNKCLERSIEALEAQLEDSRKKTKRLFAAESELLSAKKCINDLELELEDERNKTQVLEDRIEEYRQFTKKNERIFQYEESDFSVTSIGDSSYNSCQSGYNTSIQEELNNHAHARILQLQLEKRKLEMAIDELEDKHMQEYGKNTLELEREKKILSIECENLKSEVERLNQGNVAVDLLFKNTIEENVSLQTQLDSLKIVHEKLEQDLMMEKQRQVEFQKSIDFCKKEKENLLLLSDAVKSRADKSERTIADLMKTLENMRGDVDKGREMERENDKLKEEMESIQKEVTGLHKELVKTKELLEIKDVDLDQKIEDIFKLERQLEALTKEKSDLMEQLEKLQECERKTHELISQASVHSETLTTLQKDLVTEKVNNEKFKSNVEKLGLTLDVLENDVNVVLEKMLDNLEVSKNLTAIFKTKDCGVVLDVDKHLEEMASSLTEEWRQEVEKLKGEVGSLQGSNESLKTENASLQVDVSTLKSQLQSLQVQQTALQLANSQLVAEKEDLSRLNQIQQIQHESLSHDQRVLNKIHKELTAEYETLLDERDNLKKENRDLKSDIRTYVEKVESLENKLKTLELETAKFKEDSKHLSFLRAEHTKFKNDFRNLLTTSERYKAECKLSRVELQTLRAEYRDMKTAQVEMKNELANKVDVITTFQMENVVLQQRCDMLQENLNKMDLTRVSLLDSFSELCRQSLVCMADSMDRQSHSQMEAKRYWEQYNHMLRQKDKLEEKIFDFYKKLENVNTKKSGLASLVRRVRKAGSGIMSRSRSNRRSSEEDASNTAPAETTQAEPQVAGPSCSGSAESNNSSNGNETDEDSLVRASESFRRTPSGSLRGQRPRDEIALRRSQRQARRNSVASEEQLLRDSPSLGSIGSRRTVYISEDEPAPSPTPIQSTPLREDNPPLLVYNRISTVIGADTLCTLGNQTNLPEIPRENLDSKKPPNPKETAVWYEYGCV